jgi:hypothetical protein
MAKALGWLVVAAQGAALLYAGNARRGRSGVTPR